MRLINAATLTLREFVDKDRPGYAILSHTWGDDEVSLQEIKDASGQSHLLADRKGFQKIQNTSRRALADGFDWVWVDTCCIDKTSSAKLTDAINSMYRWYSPEGRLSPRAMGKLVSSVILNGVKAKSA